MPKLPYAKIAPPVAAVTSVPAPMSPLVAQLLAHPEIFDPRYYSQHYLGRPVPADYAAAHFVLYGGFDQRNPSAAFSTRAYLQDNPDVQGGQQVPAVHYLTHGRREGRVPRPVPPAPASDFVRLAALEPPVGQRVAITIHAFYPDYNRIFARLLRAYAFPFDLFVTSPQQGILDNLQAELQAAGVRCPVTTRVVPNRGRNFGPMLVEFGACLRDYDVVGHVHTKKSLYTGAPRYDWGLHSITGVLGSPEYVNFVLHQLTGGGTAGLVSAEKHPTLPFWAYHWLKNHGEAQALGQQLGIPVEPGFITYPVGGMFWARREALAAILAKDWQYDDFPPEAGQIDGTIQHALERLVGAACTAAGFGQLRWQADAAGFSGQAAPGQREFMQQSKASVKAAIAGSDVVAFDIFDTLLYRTVAYPEDVRDHLSSLLPNYREHRFAAEHALRLTLKPGTDVRTPDIARALAERTALPLSDAFALLSRELAADLAVMRPRLPVLELVRYARQQGKRVIYVSDMYYGEAELTHILNHLHIPLPDRFYVSSAVGLRKDAGALWGYVRAQEAGALLHFGDNMTSDIQNASDHGIPAVYIPSLLEKTRMVGALQRAPTAAEWALAFPFVEHFGQEPFFC